MKKIALVLMTVFALSTVAFANEAEKTTETTTTTTETTGHEATHEGAAPAEHGTVKKETHTKKKMKKKHTEAK